MFDVRHAPAMIRASQFLRCNSEHMAEREPAVAPGARPPAIAFPAPRRDANGRRQRPELPAAPQPSHEPDLLEQRLVRKPAACEVDIATHEKCPGRRRARRRALPAGTRTARAGACTRSAAPETRSESSRPRRRPRAPTRSPRDRRAGARRRHAGTTADSSAPALRRNRAGRLDWLAFRGDGSRARRRDSRAVYPVGLRRRRFLQAAPCQLRIPRSSSARASASPSTGTTTATSCFIRACSI